jgi:Glycosyl transferase family 2
VITLGIVIPCYRQERFLPRTLAALSRLPGDWRASGALVLAARAEAPLPALAPGWRTIESRAASRPLTPGAARMAGALACEGDWILFVDADVEVESAWLEHALSICEASVAREPKLCGLWGRIEEWFVDGSDERPGARDLYRVGDRERAVDYLATLALYRRDALLAAGGYDARLSSEEDFELGLRLRARGGELRSLGQLAAKHWSAPRPSLGELARRWNTGLCFGQGQVLRLYAGRPGFPQLLKRQALYVATLALWLLSFGALLLSVMRNSITPFAFWLTACAIAFAVLAVRKRSPWLAAHAVLSWTLNGLGMLVGWFRLGPGRGAEVAC